MNRIFNIPSIISIYEFDNKLSDNNIKIIEDCDNNYEEYYNIKSEKLVRFKELLNELNIILEGDE